MRKEISWGSPKQYQKGWEEESSSNPAKLPKPKSKYCKLNKATHQHEYGEWKEVYFSKAEPTGFWERHCIHCQRKDTWMAPYTWKGNLDHDLLARPPGFKSNS